MLQPITSGNTEMKKGGAAVPRHAYRAQTTVIMCSPAALAADYSDPVGPRLSEPHPRRSLRAFTQDHSGNADSAEQGAAGYDPQVVAMQSLSLATIVYPMARGSSPEP